MSGDPRCPQDWLSREHECHGDASNSCSDQLTCWLTWLRTFSPSNWKNGRCASVFQKYYHALSPTPANESVEGFPQGGDLLGRNRSDAAAAGLGGVLNALPESVIQCSRERPVLCLLLMLGTLWMGYTLYQFKRRYVSLYSEWVESLNRSWAGARMLPSGVLTRSPFWDGPFQSSPFSPSFCSCVWFDTL